MKKRVYKQWWADVSHRGRVIDTLGPMRADTVSLARQYVREEYAERGYTKAGGYSLSRPRTTYLPRPSRASTPETPGAPT